MPAFPRLDADLALYALFLALAFVGVLRHELWRDEIRAWVVANRSGNLAELFGNIRFEGHPSLWFLVLRGLGKLGGGLVSMQALQLATAAAAAWAVLRYAPFRRLDRVLLVFGYFVLYEYGVISRNYPLGMLLLFAACALLSAGSGLLALSPVLFLLAQTSVFGFVFSGGLLAVAALDDRGGAGRGRSRRFRAGLAVTVAGLVLSVLQMRPAPGYAVYAEWHTALDWERAVTTLSAVWNSWVPIPAPQPAFWNSNIVPSAGARAAASLVLLAAFAAAFRRRLPVLLFFSSTSAAFLLLFYVKVPGYMRHHGHLFLALVASAWLMAGGGRRALPRWAGLLLTAVLATGVAGGAAAWVTDVAHPFSRMEDAARVIRGQRLDRLPVLGHAEYTTGPLSELLGKEVFILGQDRFAWFTAWDGRRYTGSTDPDSILAKAGELARERRAAVLVMNDDRLEAYAEEGRGEAETAARRRGGRRAASGTGKPFTLRRVAELRSVIVEDESYYIYVLKLPRKPAGKRGARPPRRG